MSLPFLPLLLACVVRYGEEIENPVAQPAATAAATSSAELPDLLEREQQLLALLDGEANPDTDKRDRLHAAQQLTVEIRRGDIPPEVAVDRYLARIVEIEARSAPQALEIDGGDVPLLAAPIQVEELGEPDPVETGGEDTVGSDTVEMSAADAMDAARAALAEEDYELAVGLLAPHPAEGEEAPEGLEDLRSEAIDGWVHQERERAGQLFVEARALPEGERQPALREVEAILQGLLDDYPDTSYTKAIQRNLGIVRKELE